MTTPPAPLTSEERRMLEDLGREALRAAAGAENTSSAIAWAEAGCDCLRVASAPDSDGLSAAGGLFDRKPADAPFAAHWEKVTAPLAARAEAVHVLDIEHEIDREADRLSRT